MPTVTLVQLPAGPLVELVEARGGMAALRPTDALARAFYRAREAGELSVWAADRLSVRLLGLHPISVFGADAWFAACADD